MLKSGKKLISGFEDITPEQEHYIGRSVAAVILSKYRYCNHRNGQRYVNVMGQTLAQASDRPETFGGYHFLILDTDEINALSAPGGFVFVTKGAARVLRVRGRHGLGPGPRDRPRAAQARAPGPSRNRASPREPQPWP